MTDATLKKLRFMTGLAEWLASQEHLTDVNDQRKCMEQIIQLLVDEEQMMMK